MTPRPKKQRLDLKLVELNLAPSRTRAQALIMAGKVLVDDRPADKPALPVSPESIVTVRRSEHPYVSRGGLKLAHGLKFFNLDPAGLSCLDIGASTGGFTDVLLRAGAARVTAVDVGYGQLDYRLRTDDRVKVLERTNARHLTPEMIDHPVQAVVSDVSFISLTKALPPSLEMLEPDGWLTALIKPQFEVGREKVGKGGVVRIEAHRQEAVDKITAWLAGQGLTILGTDPSPILGPKGNKEFLVGAVKK